MSMSYLGSVLKPWKTTKTPNLLILQMRKQPRGWKLILARPATRAGLWTQPGWAGWTLLTGTLLRQALLCLVEMWLLKDTATEVRDQVPSLWSQDPLAPHKRHQPHLEQNGFNQLRHPHSPGSGATKRLGSCPQRTVRLMCLSTLQGSAGQARGGGQGGRKWLAAGTQESKGAPAGSRAPGPSPNTPALPSLAGERSWRRDRGASPSSRGSSSSCFLHQ